MASTKEKEDIKTEAEPDKPYVESYTDRVEDELKIVEDKVADVREKLAAAKGSSDESAPFHELRASMRDLAHASALLRTGHPTPLQTETFDNSEQWLAPAPKDNHGTWGAEDLERDDIHHGETGLNRVAAQRVKDAKERDYLAHPISRPAPKPTTASEGRDLVNSALVPTNDDPEIHHGKDGLNRPAAERQEATDAGYVKPVPEQVAESRHAGK